ncbi:MAG TPA: hypothetical protein P5029_05005, partial [Methanolinea sp.]|nr:hypothetical protein [Methanolinea sp.]
LWKKEKISGTFREIFISMEKRGFFIKESDQKPPLSLAWDSLGSGSCSSQGGGNAPPHGVCHAGHDWRRNS